MIAVRWARLENARDGKAPVQEVSGRHDAPMSNLILDPQGVGVNDPAALCGGTII